MRLLAIDFGTSNTIAALAVDGQAPRTVTFDDSPLLPSAVFVAADGSVSTGREAQRQARLDPARFEPNPKRRIDDGEMLLGDRVVPVVDVIAAVLRTVAVEVRRQLGGATPDEVRLTHPAQWGAARQNVLISAARAAGLGTNLVLLPEPVAAAAQFTRLPGRSLPPGGTVAVYDLGGGTFDVAVVGRTAAGKDHGDPAGFTVLAEAGLPDLGGLDFDQAVLDQVGRSASATDPARWQQILRPVDAGSRRSARALAEDVRAAKETLSRYAHTEIALPDPFVDAHLTRSEFEGLIRPNLLRSVEVLIATLSRAGVTPDRLTGIFLVGGSSRIPLVAGLIQDRLRITPVALDQPETAVALGALLVPVRREGHRTTPMSDPPRPPVPATGSGPMSGSAPIPVLPALPVPSGAARRPARRRGLLVGGAALIAAVIVAVVLLVVGSLGGGGTTGSSTPVPPSTASSAAASSAAGATTGLGPGNAFTAGELAFMGPSVNSLANCTELTESFNDAVPAGFKVQRAVRCQGPDVPRISSQVLVYVLTAEGGHPNAFLDRIRSTRVIPTDALEGSNQDTQFTASAAKGRLVTGDEVKGLGTIPTSGAGVPVLAWSLDGHPYIGLITVQGYASGDDLTTFWETAYKPR